MMGTWMLHAVLATAALGVAGFLAERALHLLGRPARGVWLAVLGASAAWPLLSPAVVRFDAGSAAVIRTAAPAATAAARAVGATGPAVDAWLLLGWCIMTLVMAVTLLLSAETLKQERRRWRSTVVAGQVVAVSGWLGPAVVGFGRPRIVLPGWVLGMDDVTQRLVVLHEREHVRAGDSRSLLAGLLVLCLLPWCLPVWWQFHRLRLALETDCDRRVLATGPAAREYAHALLAVAERRRHVLLPLAGMSSSRRALERRIRLMAATRSGRRSGRPAMALLAGAALVSTIVASTPLPVSPLPSALTAQLRASAGAAPAAPLPGGALPGDPGEQRLAEEISRHHAAALDRGLPAGSIIWFIVDRNAQIRRTGIDRGAEPAVAARLRARYPRDTSGIMLGWTGVPVSSGAVDVIWLITR